MESAAVPPPIARPTPSPESLPFWQAARNHRFEVPQCNRCGKFWFPPSHLCPHCLSNDFHWSEISGRGRVHSFVVFHRVYSEAFADKVPYVVAVIALDEGPRMLSNIVDVDPAAVKCGLRVAVCYDDIAPDCTVPRFRLAEEKI